MRKVLQSVITLSLAVCAIAQTAKPLSEMTIPIPADYREWIFLTSGIDMTYATAAVGLKDGEHSIFDNVFVNPEAYKVFKQTGAWPDNTTFVLENRVAEDNVSINKGGHTQSAAINGLELHVKRNNEWSFYIRGKDGSEHLVPRPASCYTCHEAHAAVDTTFAQFYPTALPIAKAKNTVSAEYLKELGTQPAK